MPDFPSVERGRVPVADASQMREVDRLMTASYLISLEQMMENAGRCLATLVRRLYPAAGTAERPVLVMAGPGGNGGGALVAARRLANWGLTVRVALATGPRDLTAVTRHQLQIAARIGVAGTDDAADPAGLPAGLGLVIDGLIGYSLQGAPRRNFANLIAWANASAAPVVALDVPSGLDAASGRVLGPCVRASVTLALALPKKGSLTPGTEDQVGDLYVADIGVPPGLYASRTLGLPVPRLFQEADIVRIR